MIENQETVTEWGTSTFGRVQRPMRAITRLNKEVAELLHEATDVQSPNIGGEIADIMIVLYQVASAYRVDLSEAVDLKMKINRQRKWLLDGLGCAQHIEE